MQNLKFEDLPTMVSEINRKVDRLERLLEMKNTQVEGDKLLTVNEASKLLSLAVPTLYSMVCREQIPFHKKSKRLYFSKNELEKWIKSGRDATSVHPQRTAVKTAKYLKKKGERHA